MILNYQKKKIFSKKRKYFNDFKLSKKKFPKNEKILIFLISN